MRRVDVVVSGVVVDGVEPVSFWERFRGVHAAPHASVVVIPGWTVHGLGLASPLQVLAVGSGGRVLCLTTLEPGGFIFVRAARWMLEFQRTPTGLGLEEATEVAFRRKEVRRCQEPCISVQHR